jgi:hypothetical protein
VPGAKSHPRPAVIPPAHHAELLAAFNGGFKTEHGHYGMQVDGVTLVAPREFSCTIAARRDGSVEIRPWKKIRDHEHDMLWWRQTPPCLYEKGKMHGSLWEEESRGWGAAVGGEVVIRRSAIGLDESGRVLFVAIANFSTARAIADAMKHAGAVDIAQLDVNWTFPKFLVFQPSDAGALQGEILVEGFVHEPGEYIRDRSPRDFFYLTRSEP